MADNEKKISIVIPCFNVTETLERTWASLKAQTMDRDELEFIFVDDASTDDGATWNMLRSIESQAPDSVLIIHLDENLRQGGARNVGISYARGRYLMFVDADDELVPDACERLYGAMTERDADIIMFNCIYRTPSGESPGHDVKRPGDYVVKSSADRASFLNGALVNYGCWNKIYDMELVRKAGAAFPEHRVFEEPLFVYPCFLYAGRISLLTDELYIYNIHEGSVVTSVLSKKLTDHPQVQLELYGFCKSRDDVYTENREAIDFYFLMSYYLETLCFSVKNPGSFLPLEFLQAMQEIVRSLVPSWRDNYFIKKVNPASMNIFGSLDREFVDQQELDGFLREACSAI